MAALSLGVAGYALGGPLGGLVGSLAGSLIDRAFTTTKPTEVEGPRLESLSVMTAAEGAAVLRSYGRMRLNTQLIWASGFREVATTETEGGGGKAITGGSSGNETSTTSYGYYISLAVGLCEGPIVGIGKVWADGKLLDMSGINWRLYLGDQAQGPDPKIEAIEGAGVVPGFRGLAYIVFDELPIAQFGNRIPQLTVETIRRPPSDGARLEDILTGVTIIPSLGEFAYATESIYDTHLGQTSALNRHAGAGKADFLLALDQLQAGAPNVDTVSLVTSWHGTDLRCGVCQIKPKVEFSSVKATTPWAWKASGINRAMAEVVSSDGLGVLLGGAPADRSVVQAIIELKARGFRVVLYPFVMMDVPPENTLPNPYSANAATVGQPAFPWRGRITCSPAPGYAGTVDKTPAAATQVNAFFGTATAAHFGAWNGDTIPYSGPAEWSYRRMVLHLAKLSVAAGGVDAFIIGSELVGLTTVRSDPGTFPAVAQLVTLAADVKAIVGSCKVGYAADWSEYAGLRPSDGSHDVYFHLDPLWSSNSVDFIGIDNYLPLSDWRSGASHIDAGVSASIYDHAYLKSNVEGGELYDWYYATSADREAQLRTPIADTAYGESWVFRQKDIRGWWTNLHHDRPDGVRSAVATGWVPQSKPIWFTEFGCPAIEKGTNQPNVFYDPKSSESFFPYFSRGRRDDLIQRSYYEAVIAYWDPAAGSNPISTVYHAPMIATDRLYAWTWDARPYPQFPANTSVWRDGSNWRRGHWLSGRLGLAPLADVVADITRGLGVEIDVSGINGIVRGYTLDSIMSARAALQPLMQTYFFDAVETAGRIRFVQRGGSVAASFTHDGLVQSQDSSSPYTLTRAQETDLPGTAHLKFIDPENDYQIAEVYARRQRGSSQKAIELSAAIVFDVAEAQGIADILMVDSWVMRETANLIVPPSAYALEPTDVIALTLNGRAFQMRLDQIGCEDARPAVLTRTDPAVYVAAEGAQRPRLTPSPGAEAGPAVLVIMDLPMLNGAEVAGVPRLAGFAAPWSGVTVYRSPATTGYVLDQVVVNSSTIGRTTQSFYSGPLWRWDRVNALYLELPASKALSSKEELLVLAGANSCAVQNGDGEWEVLQFATAELIGVNSWRLTNLLRGQLGSEHAMRDPVAAGAAFVLLDGNMAQSNVSVSQRGTLLNWKWGPSARPIDDPTYQSEARTFSAIGLRPYAPVHLSGLRNASTGDWVLSWRRRTRVDGDNWDALEVPLAEETESYAVEIVAHGAVVRSIGLSSAAFTYTAAMQINDFGGLQASLEYRVYQNSFAFGRGSVATAHISDDRRV